MSQNETQQPYAKGLSLQSVLLLVLVVGVAAGATAYAIGNVLAATANTLGTPQKSTGHNEFHINPLQLYSVVARANDRVASGIFGFPSKFPFIVPGLGLTATQEGVVWLQHIQSVLLAEE